MAESSLAAGGAHSLYLKPDGTVWAWGNGTFGQLGNGSTVFSSGVPVQVKELSGVVQVAAREFHRVALKNEGTLWSLGDSIGGRFGEPLA